MLGKLSIVQTGEFLEALLGPEEQLMLAKRLAIIVMIHEGYSLYKISDSLKVSPATASKIKFYYDQDHYAPILTALKNNKPVYLAIIQSIDSMLTLGGHLPRYGQARIK